ncbi:MAG: hypothetical protein V4719_04475 [Planctomycetota bacterium]
MRPPFPQSSQAESQASWFSSVVGWLCLFLAAGFYGAVHLSPRLLTMVRLQHEYDTNHLRLVSLENQLQTLGHMAKALEDDPDFAAAMARVEFSADRPGEQRIAVEPHLTQEPHALAPQLDVVEPPWPWYTPLLKVVVEYPKVNSGLLLAAAGLVLFSFIPLHGTSVIVIGGRTVTYTTGLLGFLKRRYYHSRR